MLSVEDALNRILVQLETLDVEEKQLLDCIGQVIAEDIYAPFNIPEYSNSAMDGYAVKASDLKGATQKTPVTLNIIGTVTAGIAPTMKVGKGETVRIMTGGIIPEGTDTVIPFEETCEGEEHFNSNAKEVSIYREFNIGSNVRKLGEDIAKSSLIIKTGQLIGPAEIGALAVIGKSNIKVIRRPIVAVLATGDELVNLDDKPTIGKIYNSNSYALAAQIIKFGGIPILLGIAKDNMEEISKIFREEIKYDLLITSGGVSVGEYDLIRNALESEGKVNFWKVRMKPGKPFTFGLLSKTNIPHFGLPGNPVSCMIALEIFGRPAIYKMMGRKDYQKQTISAIMEDEISNSDGRRVFARVILDKRNDKYYARLTGNQGSAVLSSMLKADGLAIVPEDRPLIKKGEQLEIMLMH